MSCYMTASQLLSSKSLRPGDLIEIDRGTYCHWAMYSDKPGFVFNVDSQGKTASRAQITLETLETVADGSLVRKNNQDDAASARGLQKLSAQEAILNAREVLNTTVPYEFLDRNCEYYCTEWKYGEGFSVQVARGIALATGAAVGSVLGGPVGAAGGLATTSIVIEMTNDDPKPCEKLIGSSKSQVSSSASPRCKTLIGFIVCAFFWFGFFG